MDQKAPSALLRILFAIAVLAFGLSMYLEQRQLDWLQRHPISANLLTSVVGFATGGLVVAIQVYRPTGRPQYATGTAD